MTITNDMADNFLPGRSWMGSPLCTLVTVVPPLRFGEFWWLWSPLCTLVTVVPHLHFGDWGPPFALWWILVTGVPPLHFGDCGPPFALWWLRSPLCTLVTGVPPFALWWILMTGVPPQKTDLHKLFVRFSHRRSLLSLRFSTNTNVYIHSCPKYFTIFTSVLYRTYNISPSTRVCISDTTWPLLL